MDNREIIKKLYKGNVKDNMEMFDKLYEDKFDIIKALLDNTDIYSGNMLSIMFNSFLYFDYIKTKYNYEYNLEITDNVFIDIYLIHPTLLLYTDKLPYSFKYKHIRIHPVAHNKIFSTQQVFHSIMIKENLIFGDYNLILNVEKYIFDEIANTTNNLTDDYKSIKQLLDKELYMGDKSVHIKYVAYLLFHKKIYNKQIMLKDIMDKYIIDEDLTVVNECMNILKDNADTKLKSNIYKMNYRRL